MNKENDRKTAKSTNINCSSNLMSFKIALIGIMASQKKSEISQIYFMTIPNLIVDIL